MPLAIIWAGASPAALAAMTLSCIATAVCSATAVAALVMLAGRGGLVTLLLVALAAPLAARLLQPLGAGTLTLLPLVYSLVAAAAAATAIAMLAVINDNILSRRLSRLARQGLLQGV